MKRFPVLGVRFSSLSLRFSLVVVLAALLGLGTHVLLTSWSYQRLADEYWTQRLERQARYLEGIMAWFDENDGSESGVGTMRWVRELIGPATVRVYRLQLEPDTGHFIAVNKTLRWSNVQGVPPELDHLSMQRLWRDGDGAPVLQLCNCGAYRVATFRGATSVVQFGLPVSLNAELLADFSRDALLSAIAALIVAVTLSAVAGFGLMRPLLTLARRVQTIDTDTSLPEAARHDEVGVLARALERGLSDLSAARSLEQRFIAAASHELRTPVAALVLDIEHVLRVTERNSNVFGDLERMQRSARRLHDLTANLLTLSRAELVTAQHKEFNLLALCSAITDELMPLAVERGLYIEVGGQNVNVIGDPVALGQVVTNLLSNAIKFTDSGAVTVHVAPSADGARLVIEDTGIGFSPDVDPATLTKPFERGAGIASLRPGAGLGLAVVAAALQVHGGHINFEQPDSGGTRAIVWLPARLGTP